MSACCYGVWLAVFGAMAAFAVFMGAAPSSTNCGDTPTPAATLAASPNNAAAPQFRHFALPFRSWRPGDCACVIDVDEHSVELFFNAAISMDPLCTHTVALAMHASLVPLLRRHAIPFVFPSALIEVPIDARAHCFLQIRFAFPLLTE